MPRSATDATRFTSTTPHAHTKPPPSAANINRGTKPARTPGPPGETPQEKVRRLRAAADRARDAQVTTFDKLLVRGRVWADRAHRFTALSLIGATFIAGGVTVYTLGDMMIYNRRQRNKWAEEQRARHQSAIHSAKDAIARGIATEEDIKFIKREEEHDALIEAKKQKKGIFKRSQEWLFSGLKKEEEGEDVGSSERRLGYEALSEEDDGLGTRESDIVRAIEEKKMAITEKAKHAFAEEREKQKTGGPLDRIGTVAETKPELTMSDDFEERPKASGGWTSFFIRR